MKWYTSWSDESEVSQARVLKGKESYFIIYQKWKRADSGWGSSEFLETFLQKIDGRGVEIGSPQSLGSFRYNMRDEILTTDEMFIAFEGHTSEFDSNQLRLHIIMPDYDDRDAPSRAPTYTQTKIPTDIPSFHPTATRPSVTPSIAPSDLPTTPPSISPTTCLQPYIEKSCHDWDEILSTNQHSIGANIRSCSDAIQMCGLPIVKAFCQCTCDNAKQIEIRAWKWNKVIMGGIQRKIEQGSWEKYYFIPPLEIQLLNGGFRIRNTNNLTITGDVSRNWKWWKCGTSRERNGCAKIREGRLYWRGAYRIE